MDQDNMVKEETRTNLIINHLPHNLLETDFEKIFAEMGHIKSYRIMRDLKTGSSFGFGFVEYMQPADAAKAILKLNNYGIQNKRLKVSYAQPAEGGEVKDTNLYIQNLPKSYTVDDLENLFGQFGTIIQRLVFKDRNTGQPRGIAFVKFQTKAEAANAIEQMNGQIIEGGSDGLIVKIAREGTTKKNASFQAGFQAGLARGASRGRTQYSNRGGYTRGTYSDMDCGAGGFGSHSEYAEFSHPSGKIGLDRSNNRYNPIGSGGGYGTSIGVAYGSSIGIRDAATTQFRVSGAGYTDAYSSAAFANLARPAGPYASASMENHKKFAKCDPY